MKNCETRIKDCEFPGCDEISLITDGHFTLCAKGHLIIKEDGKAVSIKNHKDFLKKLYWEIERNNPF
jgi:hypothetical protein